MKITLFLFIFFMSVSCLIPQGHALKNSMKEQKPKVTIAKKARSNQLQVSKAKTQPKKQNVEYLIEKLDYLNKILPKSHRAKSALNLRLAHALSLKAEQDFIKAGEQKCKPCEKSGRFYAIRSIFVYRQMDSILSARHPVLQVEALFQQAYLYRLLAENFKSLAMLKKVIAKKIEPALMAKAWLNMGEIYFELYDYKKSLQAFNHVLKIDKSPRRRFKAFYRKIWSLSNLSLYEQSINELVFFLKSDLYSDTNLKQEEQKLKLKLEKELIVLYHYAKVTDSRLVFLYNFLKQDPEKNTFYEKNKRLADLAVALNRIGKTHDSNTVWQVYLSKVNDPNSKLKAYFAMVNNDLILSGIPLFKVASKKMENILFLQTQIKISNDLQKKLEQQAKRFFNQATKQQKLFSKNQKEHLFSLYQKYNLVYPGEVNMLSRSAFLAMNLKQYGVAQDLFQKSVLKITNSKEEKSKTATLKETMSIGQMEVAKLTQNKHRQLSAYNFYIQHGNNKNLIFKVKYQKAYISYQNKQYEEAEKRFTTLVLDRSSKKTKDVQDLRLKSAHLSLSALDQMGNKEEELARKAGIFMKEFPKKRKEFLRIYHVALLNTVKKLVLDQDFSQYPVQASQNKNILKAWETLQLVFVKEATKKEAFTYYFNKLLLAKELLKFKQMDQSFRFLLSSKNLTKKDEHAILVWKLWRAELQFDFKEVLKIIQLLKPEEQSEEHFLRLARLAQLAGQSPVPYYKMFIEKFPNSASLTSVLISAVEHSSDKDKITLLKKYASHFKKHPGTLAYLVLKTDKGRLDESFIEQFTSLDFMKLSSLNLFLERKKVIETFEKDLKKVKDYSFPVTLSGYRMTKELKKYTNTIHQLEKKVNAILKITGDWTARVFIISHLEKAFSQFYDVVIGLPLPKGLTEEERERYAKLLQEQMQGYKQQTVQLQAELNALWSRDFVTVYKEGLKQGAMFHVPLKWEMKKLLKVSKGENKKQLQDLLSSVETLAQTQNQKQKQKQTENKKYETQDLYKALQQNPFDYKALVELLKLEKKRKNEELSYYLANRIKKLKHKNKWTKL